MAYPTDLDSFTNPTATSPRNSPSLAQAQTDQNSSIIAIETKVGTGASTPTSTTVMVGTGTGTSAWQQVSLTTQVTGTLPVANGGTGVTTSTGTTNIVLSNSPTLVTPVLGVATATSINKVTITAPTTSATLTIADTGSLITSGAYAITLTATATTGITLPTTGTLATLAGTETLTNKRVTKRSNTVASSATPTINTDTTDIFTITALAEAITSMTSNLSGTPTNGQSLIIRILDNGTARGITWGASFVSRGASLPTTTVLSKYVYVGLIYNSTASVWDCVAVSQEL